MASNKIVISPFLPLPFHGLTFFYFTNFSCFVVHVTPLKAHEINLQDMINLYEIQDMCMQLRYCTRTRAISIKYCFYKEKDILDIISRIYLGHVLERGIKFQKVSPSMVSQQRKFLFLGWLKQSNLTFFNDTQKLHVT